MRRLLYPSIILAVALLLFLYLNQNQDTPEKAAPKPIPTKVIGLNKLLDYTSAIAPSASVQTQRDVFPGGLMAAMAPGIIDWTRSQLEDGQGFVILRNVNDGGNPLNGFTTLRTVRIPLASLRSAEFVLVPLDAFGKNGKVSHGQIRFLFDAENPVLVLDKNGEPDLTTPPIEDLIFSWEAWRKPGEDYDVIVGMDRTAYALSLRVFTGRQRYLEDILGKRDWFCTPLTLPGGQAGVLELLRVIAVMGDGYGRATIGHLLDDAKDAWVQAGGPLHADSKDLLAEWNELQNSISKSREIKDPNMKPVDATQSYQTLIRSCATMALYTINVATERLKNNKTVGAEEVKLVAMPDINEVPEWMNELAHVDLKGMFVRSPEVLKFIRQNKAVIPNNIPGMLGEAGLGATDDGKVIQIQYGQDKESPYSSAELIR